MNKIYNGNVEITKRNYKQWTRKLKDITEIKGNIRIFYGLELNNLQTIGGYADIEADFQAPQLQTIGGGADIEADFQAPQLQTIGGGAYIRADFQAPQLQTIKDVIFINIKLDKDLEKQLWKNNQKKKWTLTNNCSEYLLSRENNGNITYNINNISFKKSLFDKVRNDRLSAKQVFLINDMEQRRVAYELMDKIKMKQLKGKIIDTVKDDGYSYPMHLIEIKIKNLRKPSRYLNCFDPSTGREYFLETQQNSCWGAKCMSFGFEDAFFEMEW